MHTDWRDLVSNYNMNATDILFTAAGNGNLVFLEEIFKQYPDLLYYRDTAGFTILHAAVEKRKMSVLKLMYAKGVKLEQLLMHTNEHEGNILHIASKYNPETETELSCPALEIQNELINFRQLQQLVVASMKNMEGKSISSDEISTAETFFVKERKLLLDKAKAWITHASGVGFSASLLNMTTAWVYYHQKQQIHLSESLTGLDHTSFLLHGLSVSTSSLSVVLFFSLLISDLQMKDFFRSAPATFLMAFICLLGSSVCMMLNLLMVFYLSYSGRLDKTLLFVNMCPGFACMMFFYMNWRLLRDMIQLLCRSFWF